MWSAACHLLGAFAVFTAHSLWDTQNLAPFRVFTVVCGGLACIGFWITTHSPYIHEKYGGKALVDAADPTSPTNSMLPCRHSGRSRKGKYHSGVWRLYVQTALGVFRGAEHN